MGYNIVHIDTSSTVAIYPFPSFEELKREAYDDYKS
jgi:hypothetical protein